MIPTLPEKYKCKEFAEKTEMKRSGQVIPFKFIFLWETKSGYMIGPGSKKNKLADESTRCMTFTEKVDAEEVGIWWD